MVKNPISYWKRWEIVIVLKTPIKNQIWASETRFPEILLFWYNIIKAQFWAFIYLVSGNILIPLWQILFKNGQNLIVVTGQMLNK